MVASHGGGPAIAEGTMDIFSQIRRHASQSVRHAGPVRSDDHEAPPWLRRIGSNRDICSHGRPATILAGMARRSCATGWRRRRSGAALGASLSASIESHGWRGRIVAQLIWLQDLQKCICPASPTRSTSCGQRGLCAQLARHGECSNGHPKIPDSLVSPRNGGTRCRERSKANRNASAARRRAGLRGPIDGQPEARLTSTPAMSGRRATLSGAV